MVINGQSKQGDDKAEDGPFTGNRLLMVERSVHEASGTFHPCHNCEGKNKPEFCDPDRSGVMGPRPTQGDENRGSDRSVHPSLAAAEVSAALPFVIRGANLPMAS
jgi:hypothetical protein